MKSDVQMMKVPQFARRPLDSLWNFCPRDIFIDNHKDSGIACLQTIRYASAR